MEALFGLTGHLRSRGSTAEEAYASTSTKGTVRRVVRERICTPDIELLLVSLRPFHLPREFQQLFFTIVYIHLRANAQLITDVTHRLDSICAEAPKFILGDFNHCSLKKTMRTYEQHVTCATTQKNSMLNLCYGSVGPLLECHTTTVCT